MVIDDALTAIERENERLKGILPKNFARQELDKRPWVMWWISLRILKCMMLANGALSSNIGGEGQIR